MIPSSAASIIALFVQAILFGMYIATLAHCLRWFMYEDEEWKLRKTTHWPLLVITILIFLLSTSYLAIRVHVTIATVINEKLAIDNSTFACVRVSNQP